MNLKRYKKIIILFLFALPFSKVSATSLEISGWIPYWKKTDGVSDAVSNIKLFKEISPFSYNVKNDGSLVDTMKINEEPWVSLVASAKQNKVKIIPTIGWADGDAIDSVLKDPVKRKSHVKAIIDLVKKNSFDGIDIDYEGKKSETKKYFSLFLKELWNGIGNKVVSCTIEARTPLDSRYDTIPKDIEYANDYVEINKYCDRVRIMTYDQGTVDLKLNRLSSSVYVPVSDPKWVEKVIKLALKNISKKKIIIGVATYGYEYTVTPTSNGYIYDRETSFNQNYAKSIGSSFGVNPTRNIAGEMSLQYTPTSTPLTSSSVVSTTTLSADSSAFGSYPVTSSSIISGKQTGNPFRLLWWSDAWAIKDKMDLAKKLGIRGISIFKIDGGEDPLIWEIIKLQK